MTILMKDLFSKGISAEEHHPARAPSSAEHALLELPLAMSGGCIEKYSSVLSQDTQFCSFGGSWDALV